VGVLMNSIATDPEYQFKFTAFVQGLNQTAKICGSTLDGAQRYRGMHAPMLWS